MADACRVYNRKLRYVAAPGAGITVLVACFHVQVDTVMLNSTVQSTPRRRAVRCEKCEATSQIWSGAHAACWSGDSSARAWARIDC